MKKIIVLFSVLMVTLVVITSKTYAIFTPQVPNSYNASSLLSNTSSNDITGFSEYLFNSYMHSAQSNYEYYQIDFTLVNTSSLTLKTIYFDSNYDIESDFPIYLMSFNYILDSGDNGSTKYFYGSDSFLQSIRLDYTNIKLTDYIYAIQPFSSTYHFSIIVSLNTLNDTYNDMMNYINNHFLRMLNFTSLTSDELYAIYLDVQGSYNNGYEAGYIDGYDISYNIGYNDGDIVGYNRGRQEFGFFDVVNNLWKNASQRYDDGFLAGREMYGIFNNGIWYDAYNWGNLRFSQGQNEDFNYYDWMVQALVLPGMLLNVEIFPGVKLGYIILLPIVLGVVGWILHIVGKRG